MVVGSADWVRCTVAVEGSKPIVARARGGREVRYQTNGLLGEGSGGQVYLAVRLPDQEDAAADDARRVAIKLTNVLKWKGHLAEEAKLLHSLQERDAELVALSRGRVYRPVRILSGKTPYKVDDAYESALIELEYLDGPTLRKWFDDTWCCGAPPSPTEVLDEVLRVGRQLGEALIQIQAAPGGSLIHRDVKPENIMRTSRGLRLFDFNVAREDGVSSKTQHVGTSGYMAPEVVEGSKYDGRADLFSVGVILWEIAHRRRFDLQVQTTATAGRLHLAWPTNDLVSWPKGEQDALWVLLSRLVTDVGSRLGSATALIDLIDGLEEPRAKARQDADPLSEHDMISLLFELAPSRLLSVVTDTDGRVPQQELQDLLRERMQVDDPLEDWLHHEIEQAATGHRSKPRLFVLAGNAGDGKSHLLFRLLRHRLAGKPEVTQHIRAVADATHALHPSASQRDRLGEFFLPFSDVEPTDDKRVHIIAMNTGMVIRFFEGEEERIRYASLYSELQRQLGLRRPSANEAPSPWQVDVVNLDLRDLLAPGKDDGPSFAERMLDRLDPENANSIPAAKWSECQTCPALALCPVAFNLRALQMQASRNALIRTLRRVALDSDVHLSPRNLWGFMYRLLTGGVERFDVPNRESKEPCDVVRSQVDNREGEWLLGGHFSELLFQQAHASAPWSGLARHDPAFSSAPVIDHLHTRLSIKTELDNEKEIVERDLGGEGQTLAGLALDALTALLPSSHFKGRRRDAAVRRQVMFHPPTFEAWVAQDGSDDFRAALRAYNAYSYTTADLGNLSSEDRDELKVLRELTQEVFLHGNGRVVDGRAYLRVSQPNVRAQTELLVRADRAMLDPVFSIPRIVAQDVHIASHRGRENLLSLLGYSPTQVTLDVLGVRLTVDLALYEFLRRVNDGQKPSVRDLSQFQALLFIGERVGNELARSQQTKELFVWDAEKGVLYRLATDDFGEAHLGEARGE